MWFILAHLFFYFINNSNISFNHKYANYLSTLLFRVVKYLIANISLESNFTNARNDNPIKASCRQMSKVKIWHMGRKRHWQQQLQTFPLKISKTRITQHHLLVELQHCIFIEQLTLDRNLDICCFITINIPQAVTLLYMTKREIIQ